jgi:hypothetical protein
MKWLIVEIVGALTRKNSIPVPIRERAVRGL